MKVRVRLQPIVRQINLPTVIKTAVLPGDSVESLFIATQVGEIFYVRNGEVHTFLDIRSRVIELGASGGYDERGLLGLAFHPTFYYTGLFYLHYSVGGTQGPGAPYSTYKPDPCNPNTLNLQWTDRENQYDHIDTVEEWVLQSNGQPQKRRTILNLRRPFMNHNGVNSLNFSPETGRLVLTTGDGGSGFDPFHLAQNNIEIAGKIIEIDVDQGVNVQNPPAVTRFDELPVSIQQTLTVIAKGVRNIPGISYQRLYNGYIKYAGNVGQELIESIFSFGYYKPIPVTQLVQAHRLNVDLDEDGWINFGWRGWEGDFPTPVLNNCSENSPLNNKTYAFYEDAIHTSAKRIHPLTSYFHQDPRPNKFAGTALTGVQAYMGNQIPALTGNVVFTDLSRKQESNRPARGVLAYAQVKHDGKPSDYHVIETGDQFGSQSAYFVSLGTNLDQKRLFLGVYGSMRVTDFHQGSVYEIVP